jgi:hypothetical protein
MKTKLNISPPKKCIYYKDKKIALKDKEGHVVGISFRNLLHWIKKPFTRSQIVKPLKGSLKPLNIGESQVYIKKWTNLVFPNIWGLTYT